MTLTRKAITACALALALVSQSGQAAPPLPREFQLLDRKDVAAICMSHMVRASLWADKNLQGEERRTQRLLFSIFVWHWYGEAQGLPSASFDKWRQMTEGQPEAEARPQREFCTASADAAFAQLPEWEKRELAKKAATTVMKHMD